MLGLGSIAACTMKILRVSPRKRRMRRRLRRSWWGYAIEVDGSDNATAQVISIHSVEPMAMYRGRRYRIPGISWNPRRRSEDRCSLRASIRDGRKTQTSSRVVARFSPLDVISDLGIPAPQRHSSRGPGPDRPLDSRCDRNDWLLRFLRPQTKVPLKVRQRWAQQGQTDHL